MHECLRGGKEIPAPEVLREGLAWPLRDRRTRGFARPALCGSRQVVEDLLDVLALLQAVDHLSTSVACLGQRHRVAAMYSTRRRAA